jgi:ATP-dependent Clp protease ATP-binding subunit ClpA
MSPFRMHATKQARTVVAAAKTEAHRAHVSRARSDHLLLALLGTHSSLAAKALDNLGVDRRHLASELSRQLAGEQANFASGRSMQDCLRRAGVLARAARHSLIGTEHLLLAVVEPEDDGLAEVLSANALTFERVNGEISRLLT